MSSRWRLSPPSRRARTASTPRSRRAKAEAAGINNGKYRQISVTPFEPATKRSEALIQAGDERFRAVKGAPQVVLSLSRLTDSAVVKAAGEMVETLSRKGSRTLAVARSRSEDGDDFELVGLAGHGGSRPAPRRGR